jgi:hypothetical protein
MGLKYTGPAKPVDTWRRSWVEWFELAVYAAGLIIVVLDVLVWRA